MTGPRPTMSVLVKLKDELSGGFDKITSKLSGAKSSWGGLGSVVGAVGKAFAAVGSAIAVGHFFKGAIDEAKEAEEIQTRLKTAIENVGGSWSDMKGAIDDTIGSMARLTKYSDDDLKSALAHLTVTSGNAEESLKNIGLVADLASAKQIDLKTSAELVGKVMAGETGTLSRYGIIVNEGADAIQVMRDRFTGFANEEGQTFGGILQRITNGWKDFKEAVGAAIIENDGARSVGNALVDVLVNMERWIRENMDAISGFVSWVVTLAEDMWDLASPIVDVVGALFEASNALGVTQGAFRFLRVTILGIKAPIEALALLVKSAFGGIMYTIGGAVDFAGGLLRKLGIHVGDAAAKVKEAGAKMVQEAVASGKELGARTAESFWTIMGEQEEHEQGRTAIARAGSDARIQLTKAEAAERKKAQQDADRALEKAQQQFEDVFARQAPSYIEKVTKALEAQTEAIKKSNLLTDEQKAKLLEHRAELERTLPVLEKLAKVETDEKRVDLIEDQGEKLKVLRDLYDRTVEIVGQLKPETDAWQVATARQLDLEKQLQGLGKEIVADTLKNKDVQYQMNAALAISRAFMGDLAGMSDLLEGKGKKRADHEKRSADELANAARGAIELSVEFLGLDQASARVLNNVVSLADILSKGFGNLAAGDVVGAVGAVAGILGSIFGGNDEAKQIQRENTRRMAELRDSNRDLVRLSSPGAEVAGVIQALTAFQGLMADVPDTFRKVAGTGKLYQATQQSGVSIAAVDRIAKDFGITIRDSEGRIIAGAISQLLQVLQTQDLTGFGNSFRGLMDQLDAEFAVRGSVSAQEQLQRRLDVLMQASPILGWNLRNVDFTTSAGLQEGLNALAAIVPNIGNFAIGDFGQLSRDETLDWATKLADLIRSVLDAAPAAPAPGTSAASLVGDTVLSDVVPTLTVSSVAPELVGGAGNDLTRAADGIERLEDRLLEVRDELRRRPPLQINGLTVAQNPKLDEALDAILEAVDQDLQSRRDNRDFAQGAT